MIALLVLVTNSIVELCVRVKEAEDLETNIHSSEIFGPVCLLISFILALTMATSDKVYFLTYKLEAMNQ